MGVDPVGDAFADEELNDEADESTAQDAETLPDGGHDRAVAETQQYDDPTPAQHAVGAQQPASVPPRICHRRGGHRN